jgi:protein-S-isoprenylcysteine O-methyltransferase Ste14
MKKMLPPPVFMFISLICVILFGFIIPILKVIPYPYTLIGILFIVIGAIFLGGAGKLFLKYRTTLNPNKKSGKLVIEGPYKITRNPMYLGAFNVFLGMAIISGSVLSIICSFIAPLLLNYIVIPFEERVMQRTFGKQYLQYKQKVGRWL